MDTLPDDVFTLKRLLTEERKAKEVALAAKEKAARIAGAATNHNFPVGTQMRSFSGYAPYLQLRCREQHQTASHMLF